MSGTSPRDLGHLYEERLERYLSETRILPCIRGRLNVSAVAAACRFPRQVLYKNPNARAMINEAAHRRGLPGIGEADSDGDGSATTAATDAVPDARLREAERRIAQLEKRVSEMLARNAALSARLRRQTAVEETLLAHGRRTLPGGAGPLFGDEP